MELMEGTKVYAADGTHVGKIDRVVVDPQSREVTDLVVRKGILREDKLVPLDAVATATRDRVTLRREVDPDRLQRFEDSYYVPIGRTSQGDGFYDQPLIWYGAQEAAGVPMATKPVDHVTQRNIPDESVALEADAEVVTADGERIGTIDELIVSRDGEPVSLIVSSGRLSKERKSVPATWIEVITEGKVHLAVGAGAIEELPEYQPAGERQEG